MELSTKYRIAGGVFFISLAVIFVPMLFDESSSKTITIEPIEPPDIGDVEPIPEPDIQNVVAQRQLLQELVDEDGFRLDTNTKVGEPALLYNTTDATVWAVQLGSFSDDDKANVLRVQLKDEGHVTWVSHAKIDDEIWTRVAAGPFHNLKEAETYKNSAIKQFGLEAIVVRFLP